MTGKIMSRHCANVWIFEFEHAPALMPGIKKRQHSLAFVFHRLLCERFAA
jgi:hypothetical protein